jgi:hypothetical protein
MVADAVTIEPFSRDRNTIYSQTAAIQKGIADPFLGLAEMGGLAGIFPN